MGPMPSQFAWHSIGTGSSCERSRYNPFHVAVNVWPAAIESGGSPKQSYARHIPE